jgi:hypothetical protein
VVGAHDVPVREYQTQTSRRSRVIALMQKQGGRRLNGFGPPLDVTERIDQSSASSAGTPSLMRSRSELQSDVSSARQAPLRLAESR